MTLHVKDLATRCGVSADAVRYYARIGLLGCKRDTNNRYRLFGEEDARRLVFIRRAKHLGYTLGEIKQILEESRRGKSPCPLVRDIIQRRVRESRHRLDEERRLLKRMELALAKWREMPDGTPDGHSICRLIESFDEDPGRANSTMALLEED